MDNQYLQTYLSKVVKQLEDNGYELIANTNWKGQQFTYIAKRRQWRSDLWTFEEPFFLFSEFSFLDQFTLDKFVSTCKKYTRHHMLVRHIPGITSVLCFPIAISSTIGDGVVHDLENTDPTLSIGYAEMRIVIDLVNNKLHYSHNKPERGLLVLDQCIDMIRENLISQPIMWS